MDFGESSISSSSLIECSFESSLLTLSSSELDSSSLSESDCLSIRFESWARLLFTADANPAKSIFIPVASVIVEFRFLMAPKSSREMSRLLEEPEPVCLLGESLSLLAFLAGGAPDPFFSEPNVYSWSAKIFPTTSPSESDSCELWGSSSSKEEDCGCLSRLEADLEEERLLLLRSD